MSSRIYKDLTHNEVERILKDTFDKSTSLVSFKRASGGCFNTTYLVEAQNPNIKMILRVAPINHEFILTFERTMMKTEPVVYKMMKQAGVPVPNVIRFDDSHKIVDRDYIIMQYLDAIIFSSPDFPREFAPDIQFELGLCTRKIQSIKSEKFGWINPDGSVRGYDSWFDMIYEFVCELCESASNFNLLDEITLLKVDNFMISNKNIFNVSKANYKDPEPCLIHNDLWDQNVLVSNSTGKWKLEAIIDVERAFFGEREYEYILGNNDPNLMRGYGIPLDMSDEGKLKRLGYSMILDFINLYVSKVAYDDDKEYLAQCSNLKSKLENICK